MWTQLAITGLSSIIAAGVLFRQQRLLTFIATVGTMFGGMWLLLTLIDRTLLLNVATERVYLFGSIFLLVAWLTQAGRWRFPLWRQQDDILADLAVAFVLAAVLFSAALIYRANGWQADGEWVTHGYFNGDTMALAALTQRSLIEPSLVQSNLFAAGERLEYPTLLHAAIAALILAVVPNAGANAAWFLLWPVMTYVVIFCTIPLFFLLWDNMLPKPAQRDVRHFGVLTNKQYYFWQAVIIAGIISASLESFVYLQGHFFLMGLFLLEMGLLITVVNNNSPAKWPSIIFASALTLVLMLSNAVTGTAAVVLLNVFYLHQVFNIKNTPSSRLIYLGLIPIWLVLFFFNTPGDAALGFPGLSYTAAADMLRLALPLLLLGIGLLWYLTKYSFVAAGVSALIILGIAIYIFSTRDIVVGNAARFSYHALLVGFPLIIYPLVVGYTWLKRELINSTHTILERAAGSLLTLAFVGTLILPAAASVATTHDSLLFQDRQVVSVGEQQVMSWIEVNTVPESIVLAEPDSPWIIPMFTGRSLLRSNYWLSPADQLQQVVTAAFVGSRNDQKIALDQADYLFLRVSEFSVWDVATLGRPVYQNESAAVWQLR